MTGRKELESALAVLVQAYADLVTISQQTTDLLIGGDIPGLFAATAEADALLGRANALEKQFLARVAPFRAALNLSDDATPWDIAGHLEVIPGRLCELLPVLAAQVKELSRITSLNRDIVRQSLAYVRFSLRTITDAVGGPTYAPMGASLAPEVQGAVDLRG